MPPATETLVFDSSVLQYQTKLPPEFIWPDHEKPSLEAPEIEIPCIDIADFLSGDPLAVSRATQLVNEACITRGVFSVVNHGVDSQLIAKAHMYMDFFFGMKLSEKEKAHRKLGESYGYSSSFTGRFSSMLPWKETLSVRYSSDKQSSSIVHDYVLNVLGEDFNQFGKVCQEYCDAMNNLSLVILELLGIGLGVGRASYRDFFEANDSIMRLNYYPPCQTPDMTIGTGPHCDPTTLAVLHQDDKVAGLQVSVDGKWYSVRPNPHAFVVNIGETFTALSNGIYKSCLHRAVVNKRIARKSIVFFLCPEMDKVLEPPTALLQYSKTQRLYPDFTWRAFIDFTQKNYRCDMGTLHAFSTWLRENNSSTTNQEATKKILS